MYDSKKLNWIVAIPLFVAWIVYGITLKDVPVHFSGESAVSMAQPEASNSKNSQGSSNASSSQPTSTLLWISWSFKLLLFAFGLFGTLLALFQRRAWRKLIVATSLIFLWSWLTANMEYQSEFSIVAMYRWEWHLTNQLDTIVAYLWFFSYDVLLPAIHLSVLLGVPTVYFVAHMRTSEARK